MAVWLDRELIRCPVYYTLCTSQAILDKVAKQLKLPPFEGLPDGAGACTHPFTSAEGREIAIVCLFDHDREIEYIYGLLVHEAAHVWQNILDFIGEKHPSREFEAYSMQKISQELFLEYKRQRKGKRRK